MAHIANRITFLFLFSFSPDTMHFSRLFSSVKQEINCVIYIHTMTSPSYSEPFIEASAHSVSYAFHCEVVDFRGSFSGYS